ncbi:MAG: hypothetical protein ACLSHC_16840 [Bilophila wadsworthia]
MQTSAPSLRRNFGGCAALVRGRCSPRLTEAFQHHREVTLADIDESGFVTDASRPCRMPRPAALAPDRPAEAILLTVRLAIPGRASHSVRR